ncbi:unnamed protein product [Merluccius merluccius]
MTPRGGTGKLRNHWEDGIHKVIRPWEKICQYMKYCQSKGSASACDAASASACDADRDDADRELTGPSQDAEHQQEDISQLREAQDRGDMLNEEETSGQGEIFSRKWILQEAYSSDPIDQSTLTHSKSSWAEFTKGPNGEIYLHMAHMLTRRSGKIACVYHHFDNIKLRKNVLYLDLPQFKAFAKITFLKGCNECLVLTAEAFVPRYEPLDYLLAYDLCPDDRSAVPSHLKWI